MQNLFLKYKKYDSKLEEHYNPDTLFANRRKTEITSSDENVSIIVSKESLFKKIINKIKMFFKIKK